MGFRDDNVVVIEIGSLTTRAVVGLAESMTPPQVRVSTRIGKRKRDAPPPQPQQYLFDEDLEQAIKAKDSEEVDVISPIVKGRVVDWDALEIFL
jgi:actin-related protein 9